ncbi:DNA-binding protein [Dasania marina]|uniref:DNA-binding protein n=1 Tax=Dasania marina TaxID=471499 RepID=UPI0030D9AEA1|tara:strand:+ start:5622 stop:6557 length:936 start_codon:yes stop_codon:yes gene_type:complete
MAIDTIHQYRISKLADELVTQGIKPTIRRIREIQGGDTNIITQGLRHWREKQMPVELLDDASPIEVALHAAHDSVAQSLKAELDGYCDKANAELEQSASLLEDAELLIKSLKEREAELEESLSLVAGERDNLKQDLNDTVVSLRTTEHKIEGMAKQAAQLAEEKLQLAEKLEAKKNALSDTKQTISSLGTDNELLAGEISHLKELYGTQGIELENLKSNRDESDHVSRQYEKELIQIKAKVEVLTIQNECLADRVVAGQEIQKSLADSLQIQDSNNKQTLNAVRTTEQAIKNYFDESISGLIKACKAESND